MHTFYLQHIYEVHHVNNVIILPINRFHILRLTLISNFSIIIGTFLDQCKKCIQQIIPVNKQPGWTVFSQYCRQNSHIIRNAGQIRLIFILKCVGNYYRYLQNDTVTANSFTSVHVLGRIVVSIPVCYTGDRSLIPCQGLHLSFCDTFLS